MRTFLKLAWRNIWRNKRRTLITAASVFFAVFSATFMRSMQLGSYAQYINGVVEAFTGSVQIHKKGYWEDQVIDNAMSYNDSLIKKLSLIRNIRIMAPRIESFGLASFDQQTKGVAVIGIDPATENKMTKLEKKIVRGKYPDPGSDGIMVAEKLAKFLKVNVNDTLVIIGQGFHGSGAADKFPVRGILHFPSPELDNQLVYISLQKAGEFYSLENRLTSISIDLKDPDVIDETIAEIKSTLNTENYEVMSWKEMLPELLQAIQVDNMSGIFFLIILYIIIAFGIFGTVIMMTIERMKEFGVMVAIGMQKKFLSVIVSCEIFFIGLIGIFSGLFLSIPLVYYYHLHPWKLGGEYAELTEKYGIESLIYFALDPGFFLYQCLVVLGMTVLAMIYPLRRINRLSICNALKMK